MRFRFKANFQSLVAAIGLSLLVALSGCNRQKSKAEAAVTQYAKAFGARDVKFGTFATDGHIPDKAYLSATVTYNAADRHGNFQSERVGFVLDRDGDNWKVEPKSLRYTEDKAQAIEYLSGRAK
jgi:hypothetical protein